MVPKKVLLYVSLRENSPTSNLIYYLSEQFSTDFRVWLVKTTSGVLQTVVVTEISKPVNPPVK